MHRDGNPNSERCPTRHCECSPHMHPVCDASISQVHRWRKAVGGACAESTVPQSTYPHCACPICVHRQCLSMAGMVKTRPPPADSKDKSYDSKVNSSPLNPTLIGHASQPSPCAIPPTDVGCRESSHGDSSTTVCLLPNRTAAACVSTHDSDGTQPSGP